MNDQLQAIEYRTVSMDTVPGIAQVHLVSFPGAFLTCLGRRALEASYGWFVGKPQTVAFAACAEEEVVGFTNGWVPKGDWVGPLIRDSWPHLCVGLLRALIRHPGIAIPLIWARRGAARIWFRRTVGANQPSYQQGFTHSKDIAIGSLASIAVIPGLRGTGVASRLLELFLAESERRGVSAVRASTNSDNRRARAFYEKMGWRKISEARNQVVYQFDMGP